MRLLVLEANEEILHSLDEFFEDSDDIYITSDSDDAVSAVKTGGFDAILIGDNLDEDVSGQIALLGMSQVCGNVPIIRIIEEGGIEATVKALDSGASDVLETPLVKEELVARINNAVRRSNGVQANNIVKIGNLTIDLTRNEITIRDELIHFTKREYQILETLASRPDAVITKEMFLNSLYGGRDEPEIKIIDVFICKVRKRIAAANNGDPIIETVWGRGYRLPKNGQTQNNDKEMTPNVKDVNEESLQQEIESLRSQLSEAQNRAKLNGVESIEGVINQAHAIKIEEEAELDDEIIIEVSENEATNGFSKAAKNDKSDQPGVRYQKGIRMPIGSMFEINLIVIDTNEMKAARVDTNQVISIEPVVGTLLEVLVYYQGTALDPKELQEFLFEDPSKGNPAKLGMYMSQTQAAIRQLVGHKAAQNIVTLLSGGQYGMPDLSRGITAQPQTRTLPSGSGDGNSLDNKLDS